MCVLAYFSSFSFSSLRFSNFRILGILLLICSSRVLISKRFYYRSIIESGFSWVGIEFLGVFRCFILLIVIFSVLSVNKEGWGGVRVFSLQFQRRCFLHRCFWYIGSEFSPFKQLQKRSINLIVFFFLLSSLHKLVLFDDLLLEDFRELQFWQNSCILIFRKKEEKDVGEGALIMKVLEKS